jgi:hypothetical protein
VSTRGQEGPAGRPQVSDGAGLQVAWPGERRPSLLFTTMAFDQLLSSPHLAEVQAGAELLLGVGQALPSSPFLNIPGAGQTEARSLGKHWLVGLVGQSVYTALQSFYLT